MEIKQDNIILIQSEDWQVIYVFGNKFIEGHSIHPENYFKLGTMFPLRKWEDIPFYYLEDEQLSKIGWSFPEKLKDLIEELNERGDDL